MILRIRAIAQAATKEEGIGTPRGSAPDQRTEFSLRRADQGYLENLAAKIDHVRHAGEWWLKFTYVDRHGREHPITRGAELLDCVTRDRTFGPVPHRDARDEAFTTEDRKQRRF